MVWLGDDALSLHSFVKTKRALHGWPSPALAAAGRNMWQVSGRPEPYEGPHITSFH